MKKIISLILLGTFVFAMGPQGDREQRGSKKRQPPQEAITACENLTEGDTCQVTTPRGDTLDGTCEYTPDNLYFACRPEHHRGKRR